MADETVTEKKRPGRVTISPEEKFLVGRVEAAECSQSAEEHSTISSPINSWLLAASVRGY